MSKTGIVALIVAAIVLLAISTKPSDTRCKEDVMASITGTGVLSGIDALTGIYSYMLDVEDHVIYKTIVSRIDGRQLGYGLFNTVIITP